MTDFECQVREEYRKLTNLLIERELRITTMESATSGQLVSLITDTEGSSAVLLGAMVTYSNEAKIRQGVPAHIIETYGVYSLETADAMAAAANRIYPSDIAIGVTGTMGNVDLQNRDSVPGEIYFSLLVKGKMHHYYRKLDPRPSRLSYKLAVAHEVAKELMSLL